MEEAYSIKQIYTNIQNKLYNMIPENWDKLCLYASVIENVSGMRTGEMYFYYFPKAILKKPPVNLYEIASKFNLDETAYEKMIQDLYIEFEKLRDELSKTKDKVWSNVTVCIENGNFNIFYDYENLLESKWSDYERHIIWRYKYINQNLHTYGKKDRKIIEEYLKNV